MLGIFSPFKFGLKDYLGYNIEILKDHVRFLSVIINRDGQMGGVCPLYFDGAVCDFKELPLPHSPEIQKVYDFINVKKQKTFMAISKNSKEIINKKTKKWSTFVLSFSKLKQLFKHGKNPSIG